MKPFVVTVSLLFAVAVLCYLSLLRLGQPLFSDEITYFMMASRFLVEDGRGWWFLPQCLGDTRYELPFLWKPFALLRAYFAELLVTSVSAFDVFAIGRAFAVFGAMLAVSAPSRGVPQDAKISHFSAFSFLCVGTVPLYLLSGRPEPTIILLLTSVLLISRMQNVSFAASAAGMLTVLALALWGLSLHPQMVLFSPVCMVVLGGFAGLPRQLRAGAILVLVLLLAQSIQHWGNLFSCAGVPTIQRFFDAWSLRPGELASFDGWRKMLSMLQTSVRIFGFLEFYPHFPFNTLVNHRPLPEQLNALVNLLTIGFEVLLLAVTLLFCGVIRKGRTLSSAERKRCVLALTLLACLLLWCATRGKNPYTISLIHSVLVLAYLNLLPVYQAKGNLGVLKRLMPIVLLSLGIVAAASSIVTQLYSFGGIERGRRPIAAREAVLDLEYFRNPAMLRPRSFSGFLERCGLSDENAPARIFMDESGFFLLAGRPGLLLNSYFNAGFGVHGKDLFDTLSALDTIAFLLPCEDYPQLSEQYSTARAAGLCCGRLPSARSIER